MECGQEETETDIKYGKELREETNFKWQEIETMGKNK